MTIEERIAALETRVAKLEEARFGGDIRLSLPKCGHKLTLNETELYAHTQECPVCVMIKATGRQFVENPGQYLLDGTPVGKSSFPALKRDCDTVDCENVRLRNDVDNRQRELDEIYQTAGKALGYPFLCDDQTNFPGTTEKEGVVCGEHTAVTVVAELARKYEERNLLIDELAAKNTALRRELEALKGVGFKKTIEKDEQPKGLK